MYNVARQPLAADTDWLSVTEAASILGVDERTVRRRAEWEAKQAATKGRAALARIAAPPSGNGKPVWWVHRKSDPRLARCPNLSEREVRARASVYSKYGDRLASKAYVKARWYGEWRRRCNGPRVTGKTEATFAEEVVAEARALEGPGFKISFRTLKLWHRAYNAVGPDGNIAGVEALIDRRGFVAPPRGVHAGRSPEAVEFFYKLFHTENKIGVISCHETTLAESRAKGWNWAPSYSATRAWLQRHDHIPTTHLSRKGFKDWAHHHLPHLTMDWTQEEPGAFYLSDHKQCDFWVRYRRAGRDEVIRPWITTVMDGRSRCIVGCKVSPSPNQDTIVAALRVAFRDWAIPTHLKIDNGKDFRAERITGLTRMQIRELRKEHGPDWRTRVREERERVACDDPKWRGITEELRIDIGFALPYSPWSKGLMERWFRTFGERCAKHFTTWCGDKPQTRPEALKDILEGRGRSRDKNVELIDDSDVPTFEEAEGKIKAFIEWYHNHPHRGEGMNGQTPLAVWRTAKSLRRAEDNALMILMNIRGQYKVTANGVRVTLNGGALSYGASSNALFRYRGREVLVAVDEDHPADCFAYEVGSHRLIGRLDPNQRMDPRATHELHREKIKESQRAKSLARKVQRESASRTRTAVQLMNSDLYREDVQHVATGTDHASPIVVNVDPIRTRFEGVSTGGRKPVAPRGPDDTQERLRKFNERAETRPETSESIWKKMMDFNRAGGTDDTPPRKPVKMEMLSNRYLFGQSTENEPATDGDTPLESVT